METGSVRRVDPLEVLVVDDEPFLPELVVTMLQRAGYRAAAVTSAEAALDRLAEGPVRLLITDHFLGVGALSGLELIERLARLEEGPDGSARPAGDSTAPLCVVVTACFEPELLDDLAGARGVCKVLRKPFDLERLSGLVAELLGPPSGERVDPPEGPEHSGAAP